MPENPDTDIRVVAESIKEHSWRNLHSPSRLFGPRREVVLPNEMALISFDGKWHYFVRHTDDSRIFYLTSIRQSDHSGKKGTFDLRQYLKPGEEDYYVSWGAEGVNVWDCINPQQDPKQENTPIES